MTLRGWRFHMLLSFGLAFCLTQVVTPPPAWGKGPVRVTDAIGRTVTVNAPVDRLVITFNYEEFLAVAGPRAFDKVVGFTRAVWHDWRHSIWLRYTRAIPRILKIPDVGLPSSGTFSVEKVLAVRPEAVIIPKWMYDAIGPAVEQLRQAGIPTLVIDYNAEMLERHVASTLVLGEVMGTRQRARELADLYTAKVQDVRRRVASAGGPKPKVYLELGNKGPAEYGNTYTTTMWGLIIDRAGGDNIATGKVKSIGPLNPEYVLAARPDFVFIAGSIWPQAPNAMQLGFDIDRATANARLKAFTRRPGWSALPAVRHGQVYAIHHGLARTLFDYTALQFMAKAFYPEQFQDIDPEQSLRDYFAKYLPVPYTGTWMIRLQP